MINTGTVRYGMVWYGTDGTDGTVWYGTDTAILKVLVMYRYGTVLYRTVRFRYCTVPVPYRYGTVVYKYRSYGTGTVPYRTVLSRTVPVRYCTVPFGMVRHGTVPYDTIR
jgi:hypothetical protein